MQRKIATRFNGEFGYELGMIIPYANWLAEQGLLSKTVSAPDSAPLYFFSPDHTETQTRRRSGPGTLPLPRGIGQREIHVPKPPEDRWSPPNYWKRYKPKASWFDKPLLIVLNKYNVQWNLATPVNYLSLRTLDDLFSVFKRFYQIVYARSAGIETALDHREQLAFGDFELIRKRHPEVLTLQSLTDRCGGSWNLTQLQLYSQCSRFISVQGGCSILACCFGGTTLGYTAIDPSSYTRDHQWCPRLGHGGTLRIFNDEHTLIQEAIRCF